MFRHRLIFLTLSVVLVSVNSLPQLQQNIDAVFNQRPTTSITSRGFDVVVTPVPIDPSVATERFTSISGRSPCNCVPYHQCDPSGTSTPVEDGAFDGFGLIDIRFNKDPDPDAPSCEHFLDVCCDTGRTHDTSLNPTPQEQRPNRPKGCGVRNVGGVDFNITGATDNESGFGEFPWTVALLLNNSTYFCAGSLIHPSVVLTGVHCVVDRPLNSFMIRAGEWDTITTKERLPFVEKRVSKVVTHPRYNPRNVAYDYALLFLESPLTLDDHINVICLPPANSSPAPGTTCFATGWGKDVFGDTGRYSSILKRIPLPIVDFTSCQTRFRGTRLGTRFALDPSFICAGGQVGIDTCQGDGGAPLACPIGSEASQRYQLSGMVAWGIACNTDVPAAYAHVGLARDWIDSQMYAHGYDTTSYTPL